MENCPSENEFYTFALFIPLDFICLTFPLGMSLTGKCRQTKYFSNNFKTQKLWQFIILYISMCMYVCEWIYVCIIMQVYECTCESICLKSFYFNFSALCSAKAASKIISTIQQMANNELRSILLGARMAILDN